ncbi:MAG: GatB/YqeY domain-containing protein [Candidatus Omnitrophota bacterium]
MLEEKILNDYKDAMKARDSLKSSVLSCLRAEIMNTALAKKKNNLDDNEVLAVIKKQVKQHQDSIDQFTKGNRLDLAEKEAKELKILEAYLPAQLSADELKKIVEEIIVSTAASGMKDMGKVMKEATARVGASADSKTLSDLVRAKLASPA